MNAGMTDSAAMSLAMLNGDYKSVAAYVPLS